MKGVTVSIDRIVIDFTDVYWDFFNEFHKRICHFYGVRITVGDRGFQYRIKINTGEHFLHVSYKLVFAPKTRKNTLRIEVYPKSLIYFQNWLEQIRTYAHDVLFVRCDVAFDIPDITMPSIGVKKMVIVGCMTKSESYWSENGRKSEGSERGWKSFMYQRRRFHLLPWFNIHQRLIANIFVLC